MYFLLLVGVPYLFLFYYALLCVRSIFAINHLEEEEMLVALLLLPYRCIVTVNVLLLLPTMPWVVLQCVIVLFPDHTHLF